MKRILFCSALLLCACLGCERDPLAGLPKTLPPMEVYFSPDGGCTDAAVREIDAAKNERLRPGVLVHLRADRQGAGRGAPARRSRAR